MTDSDEIRPRMLVLDRGFVIVGECPPLDHVVLSMPVARSRTVRRWGTKNGLAELVNEGPQPETMLDPVIDSEAIPVRAILRVIDLPEGPWKSTFPPR